MTGNPQQAEVWYTKAIARDCKDARVHLYLGQALLQNEKYDLARSEFEAYKALAPTDKRADNGLQSIDLAQAWQESPSGYIVKHVPVLNSKQDDYSPMYGSKDYRTMLVTSSRDNATGKRIHEGRLIRMQRKAHRALTGTTRVCTSRGARCRKRASRDARYM